MNRAVQMPSRCWEVSSTPDPDSGWPHCLSKEEALAIVEADDGDVEGTVTFLDAACWEAFCPVCGEQEEHPEYGGIIHYRSRFDAENGTDVTCCEPADSEPDRLAPSTAGMEPLPGMGGERS